MCSDKLIVDIIEGFSILGIDGLLRGGMRDIVDKLGVPATPERIAFATKADEAGIPVLLTVLTDGEEIRVAADGLDELSAGWENLERALENSVYPWLSIASTFLLVSEQLKDFATTGAGLRFTFRNGKTFALSAPDKEKREKLCKQVYAILSKHQQLSSRKANFFGVFPISQH